MIGQDTQSKSKGETISGRKARWYDTLQRLNGSSRLYSKIVELSHVSPHSSVLDVGCGTGTVLFHLRKVYGDSLLLMGVDSSVDMIQVAKRKNRQLGANVSFRVVLGEQLPFNNDSFNLVVSSLTMHHLPNELKISVMNEMKRVLKPGGRCLVTDFGPARNILGRIALFFLRNHAYVKDTLHISLADLLKRVNFRQVKNYSVQFGFVEHVLAVK